MEIVGLEPRRSDLARGIVIARSARPLDAATIGGLRKLKDADQVYAYRKKLKAAVKQ